MRFQKENRSSSPQIFVKPSSQDHPCIQYLKKNNYAEARWIPSNTDSEVGEVYLSTAYTKHLPVPQTYEYEVFGRTEPNVYTRDAQNVIVETSEFRGAVNPNYDPSYVDGFLTHHPNNDGSTCYHFQQHPNEQPFKVTKTNNPSNIPKNINLTQYYPARWMQSRSDPEQGRVWIANPETANSSAPNLSIFFGHTQPHAYKRNRDRRIVRG